MNKHSRHHANPNKLGKDPDIEIDTFSFVEEDAAARRGLAAWFTRRQGLFFFPLLLLEGLNLHLKSVQSLWSNRQVKGQRLELAVLALRFVLYLTAVFCAAAARDGLRLPGGAAGGLRAVHGCLVRAEPHRHADRAAGRQARLPGQAGAYLAERVRRLVGHRA